MKKIIGIIMGGIFLILTASAQENLITNGDMMQWKKREQLPQGYKLDPRDGAERYFTRAAEKYENKNALKVTYSHKSEGSTRFFTTPVMILSPGTYQFSCYVKGKGFMRNVSLTVADADEQVRRSAKSTQNSVASTPMGKERKQKTFADWTRLSATFKVLKEGKYELNFNFNNMAKPHSSDFLMISNLSLIKQ